MLTRDDIVIHPITGRKAPAYLTGVITPMYTTATPEGDLSEAGFRSYTDWLIDTGAVTTLFPRSGLGQMYRYQIDQIYQLIDIIADQASGRIPVMPGCAGEFHGGDPVDEPAKYVRQTIDLCNHADERGCIAAVVVMPYALLNREMERGAQEDTIFQYYRDVTSSVDIPVLIYQPPVSRRYYIARGSLIRRVVEHLPGIVGMKYSTDDLGRLTRMSADVDGSDFTLIAGDEAVFLPAFSVGIAGVIGQGATNNPEVLRGVYERAMSSDYPGAWVAARDVFVGIRATRGFSPAGAGLAYLGRKGVAVDSTTLEGTEEIRPADLDRIESELDAVRSKYRQDRWWVED